MELTPCALLLLLCSGRPPSGCDVVACFNHPRSDAQSDACGKGVFECLLRC